ncbi:NAD(P)H-dependent oxidoreductase subunit E [Crossiella sp. SN42]|uniref:NAD(P)H-dependent oxidoreductase subunit E n=1 Tax=Crossiella sp. SN42 TaxID=2944808 RepID=UPI00207D2372|nr:NAD(P)H-dependent oxidoreductase subunit E [Crossiella sp. SN42]MCO1578545.1 NAD(P)H-dependent oxidoreductase subunit E [Crossiella sp. SN42]
MDSRFRDAAPSAEERAAIDVVLDPSSSGRSDGGPIANPHDALLPALHSLNDRVGWISEAALDYLSRRLTLSAAEVFGVATSCALFSLRPRPRRVLHVCAGPACRATGSTPLCRTLERRLGPADRPAGGVLWQPSPCLGLCERAPAALVFEAGDPPRTAVTAPSTVDSTISIALDLRHAQPEPPAEAAVPQAGAEQLVLLRRIGRVDPASLSDYLNTGGYTALHHALRMGPAEIIRLVLESGLPSRDGAGVPVATSWEVLAGQRNRPHYLVCDADESHPGSFADRVLLEGDPFAVVEAMTIAGIATGSRHGYLHLRGEYPRAHRVLTEAVAQAREKGLLGRNILGSGRSFDLEVRRGGGTYPGRRGEPRGTPPFPAEPVLLGKPTVVHSVETLVAVPPVITGTPVPNRLYCVSGIVRRPGVYELPRGSTLHRLVAAAGGVRTGRTLRAALVNGALSLPAALDRQLPAAGPGSVVLLDEEREH